MRKLTILLALLFALCVGANTASAQTAITSTTLSAAISVPAQTQAFTISVASATNIAANGILWIEGSIYRVLSVSGTTITVLNTLAPSTHLTSAQVYVVPVGAQVGYDATGSCLRSTAGPYPAYSPYTIMFNTSNGHMLTCRGNAGSRTWVITAFVVPVASSTPPVTP